MEKQQESRCCCSETPTENVTETQDKKAPQLKSAEGASGPMAMGMNMAKKMMSQMGQGTKSLRDSPLRRAPNWERGNQLREE